MNRLGGDALHTVLLIVRREFLTRVRSRFFLIGTVLLMVLLAGYIVIQVEVINRSSTTVKVGFAGAAQALAKPLSASSGGGETIQTQLVDSVSSGEDLVRSGDLDALVSGDPAAPVVEVKDQLDPTVATNLTALVQGIVFEQALAGTGVDPTQIEAKVAAAGFHLVALDPNAAQQAERSVVGIFVAALLYIALQVYGQFVTQGVIEEKANKIIEIMLSTVRPRQLLLGKVIGIGLVGLLQLVLVGAVALITVMKTNAITVPNVGVTAVMGALLWFVLGFLFYALIYAAGGSMITRQEDAAAVTVPITLLLVGTYLAFFWVVANPGNPIGIGLSMLPPFAPVLMPARMATGDAQAWQVLVAVALMVAAIIGLNGLAARIYANSVLRVGLRVPWRSAWKGVD